MIFIASVISSVLLQNLSANLLRRLLGNNRFYELLQFDRSVGDPEQRITDDVQELCKTLCEMWPELRKPLATILFLSVKLWPLVGTQAVGGLLAYMVGGIALIKVALPNFKTLVARESKLEGTFKFVHARVRTHAESIAFFGGGMRECALVSKRFDELEQVVAQRLQTDWFYGLFQRSVRYPHPSA